MAKKSERNITTSKWKKSSIYITKKSPEKLHPKPETGRRRLVYCTTLVRSVDTHIWQRCFYFHNSICYHDITQDTKKLCEYITWKKIEIVWDLVFLELNLNFDPNMLEYDEINSRIISISNNNWEKFKNPNYHILND